MAARDERARQAAGGWWFALALVSVLAVQWSVIAGFEQPGRAARHALLLALAGPLVALLSAAARRALVVPRVVILLLAVPLASGVLWLFLAGAGERSSVLQDLLILVALWAAALVAAGLPPAVTDDRLDRALGLAAVLSLVVIAGLGLVEAWGGWASPVAVKRPGATYVNRNVAAQALVMLVPLALAYAGGALARSRRFIGLASAVPALGGLMLLVTVRSRGAWIAAGIGMALAAAVWLWVERSSRGRIRWGAVALAVLAAAAVLAALVPVEGPEPLPSVGRSVELLFIHYEGSTLETREVLWRNSAAMALEYPWLGVGPGRFRVVYPLFHRAAVVDQRFGLTQQPVHVHNDLLQAAVELGWPAAVALLVLIGGAVLRTAAQMQEISDPAARLLLAGRLAALVGVCLHAMVSFPWGSPGSAWLAWWLVGRGWSGREPALALPARFPRAWVTACLGAGLVVAIAGLTLSAGLLGAQRSIGRGLEAWERGDLRAAAAHAREAFERAHHRHELGLAGVLTWSTDKDPASSLEVLEPALAAYPNHINLLLDTGARRLKAGDAASALSAFSKAVGIKPELARGWLGVAMASLELGDEDLAREACTYALRDPDLPAAATFCHGNRLVQRESSTR